MASRWHYRVEKVVSDVLGHSQAAFTMDRYQHVSLDLQRQASAAVEALQRQFTGQSG